MKPIDLPSRNDFLAQAKNLKKALSTVQEVKLSLAQELLSKTYGHESMNHIMKHLNEKGIKKMSTKKKLSIDPTKVKEVIAEFPYIGTDNPFFINLDNIAFYQFSDDYLTLMFDSKSGFNIIFNDKDGEYQRVKRELDEYFEN